MKIMIAGMSEIASSGIETELKQAFPNLTVIQKENDSDLKNLQDIDLILSEENILFQEVNTKIPCILFMKNYTQTKALEAVDQGVDGVLPSSADKETILKAIRFVLAGGVYFPLDDSNKETEEKAWKAYLSPRQQDVMHLMSEGKSNKVIAYELGVTEGTVKVHIASIFKALEVKNRTEAVLKAKELLKK